MKTACTIAQLALLIFLIGCNNKEIQPANLGSNAATPATPASTPNTGNPPPENVANQKNLLAFGAGAMVVDKTSESESTSSARRIIDEATFFWQSADGQVENQSITLELPARTTLKTVGFDTSQPTYYDHRAAKDVVVEVADSATGGFQKILAVSLKDDTDKQDFPVEQQIAGRYVRFTARNNHGSSKAILLKELRGYGDQEEAKSLDNISGTYTIEYYGELHLKQEGTSITGCYTFEEGVVTGGIEGRTVTLNWVQRGNRRGFAAINFIEGGKKFLSAWWSGAQKSYDSAWDGEKKSDQPGNCAHLKLDGETAQSQLEKNLQAGGRAVVYGINFDFNSDRIRDESKPILTTIVALLKKNSDWKMQIEGHTDNIGTETFNQTLSEKRAAAVRNYLTTAGIDAGRLSSAGFGFSKPVATNDTEAGRAQNRRVELMKR